MIRRPTAQSAQSAEPKVSPDQNLPSKKHWAQRIDLLNFRRLYESDAQGMLDREMLDDVGYGIYIRA